MKSRRLCRIFGSNWTMLDAVLSFNETRSRRAKRRLTDVANELKMQTRGRNRCANRIVSVNSWGLVCFIVTNIKKKCKKTKHLIFFKWIVNKQR